MEYDHDKKQSMQFAKSAFGRIQKEGLCATPAIFELWYVYYSGQSPEITGLIDVMIANEQKITDRRCMELYHKYLSESSQEQAVRRAGDQINTTIRNMAGAVREVKTATHDYSGKLGGINRRMQGVKDVSELRVILDDVMSDTAGMLERNQRLEKQLDQSSQIMEALQRDLEHVRKEAMTDGLTGLVNRKAFDAEIDRVAAESRQSTIPFSLLMVDIDHFKNFNDNFGHQIGDQVLRLVARTLTDGVKGRDTAARYGGEEFAIILPDTPLHAAVIVAEALRKEIAGKNVVNRNTGEKLSNITMSVGVAEFVEDEDVTSLIERADAALYTAKHNGRNQVASAPTPGKRISRG